MSPTRSEATRTALDASVPGRRGGGGRGARHAWEEVAPGIHAWVHPVGEWGLSNAVLVAGDEASTLIDTQWDEPMTRWMLSAAPEHPPIDTLVYTHPDGDHIWGGREVGAREIIGTDALLEHFHEESPRRLAMLAALSGGVSRTPLLRAPGPLGLISSNQLLTRYVDTLLGGWSFAGVRAVSPNSTFSGATGRTVGSKALTIYEAGAIHSSSDSWLHLPGEGVVVAGDLLFIGVIPVMWVGCCDAWITALEAMIDVEPEVVVPGHGPVGGAKDLAVLRDHFTWLGEVVAAGEQRGDSATRITESAIAESRTRGLPWSDWHGPERMHLSVVSELRHLAGEPAKHDLGARPGLMRQAAGIADRLQRGRFA